MSSTEFNIAEALILKSAEESLRKSTIDRETSEISRDTAKVWLESAKAKAEADKLENEERIKLAHLTTQYWRESQRPFKQHGVVIRRDDNLWVAELGDIRATGDTPAMAASEFDHIWVFGDT
ncbi:MAG: hypothetical protein M0R50_09135 [Candidatus Cloacimonetes bacterium]|jgi:hypothetical protein|nr:hypothetical protein [Candidatus Cloacimonadota bacterium]